MQKRHSTKNTQTNKAEETLTKEQKINVKNLKKIMNREKIILPSLRNIEWRTVRTEKEKNKTST